MKPHVMIGLPSYDGKVHLPWVDSISEMFKCSDHQTTYRYLSGDSLITRARNKIFSQFIKDSTFSHLIWIDSDVIVPGDAISILLQKDVDVISAPVPIKGEISRHGLRQSTVGYMKTIDERLYSVTHAATGCFMISRAAAESLADYCTDSGRTYNYEDGQTIFDLFRVGLSDGFYESEDWHLSQLVRDIGYTLYSDSSFPVTHIDTPRSYWHRPSCDLAETIVSGDYRSRLDESLIYERWATNDIDLPDRFFIPPAESNF